MRELLIACALAALLCGCDDMSDQPRDKPFRRADHREQGPMQAPPETVSTEPPAPPPPLTLALIQRGRERFDIYCAPCHGRTGDGKGMIAERGFPAPPSYHEQRLRDAPVGHFVDVITNGYGAMYSYADRVAASDRWAIAAYIKALQASQTTDMADLSPEMREKLR